MPGAMVMTITTHIHLQSTHIHTKQHTEEEESSQDTTTTPPHIPSTPPTPTLKGVKSVHTMTLTETKPLMPVALQDEFAELMMRCPQWMTQDTITRWVGDFLGVRGGVFWGVRGGVFLGGCCWCFFGGVFCHRVAL